MERYVAVIAKSNDMLKLIEINSDTLQITRNVVLNRDAIPQAVVGCRPINFSIDNNKVVESMGSFDRLEMKNGVQPCIVLQELATSVGTIIGYRLLNPIRGTILAVKKEDILARQSKSDIPLLQNGIIRGNKVNCYSHSNFPRFIIGTKTRKAVKKPKMIKPEVQDTSNVQSNNNFLDKFTTEQRRELSMAKKDNIDIRLIANPELSSEQMRVLWVSKKKGAYSEYFAKPEYSVDVMKFYADRLLTKKMVQECADLLSNPKYSVSQLTELYLAVCEGIDYTTFKDLPANSMYIERERLRSKLWSSEFGESDFVNDAIRVAEKLKK